MVDQAVHHAKDEAAPINQKFGPHHKNAWAVHSTQILEEMRTYVWHLTLFFAGEARKTNWRASRAR